MSEAYDPLFHYCGWKTALEMKPDARSSSPVTAVSFQRGEMVRKRSGAQWQGRVVGEYSTALTPEGYAVESDAHAGSVQIYPAAALERVPD